MDNAFSVFTGSRYRKASRVPTPPTMLTDNEIRLLYWLTKMQYRGVGDIVELGCWLGGSTVAMQRGANAHNTRIVSYDQFLWDERWAKFAKRLGVKQKKTGDSFFPEFNYWMQQYDVNPIVTRGDVLDHKHKRPIEILFVDIMKSRGTAQHVVSEFFTRLVPGAFLIHQDFKFKNTWWIQLWQWQLRKHFIPVLNCFDSSTVVFQCVEPIEDPGTWLQIDRNAIDDAFAFAHWICAGSTDFRRKQLEQAHSNARKAVAGK